MDGWRWTVGSGIAHRYVLALLLLCASVGVVSDHEQMTEDGAGLFALGRPEKEIPEALLNCSEGVRIESRPTRLLRTIRFFSCSAGLVLVALTTMSSAACAASPTVVVELFTSEGCSSCPPADRLIGELATRYADQPVYLQAFHVDYWNRLGWIDRFSDSAYSNRQRHYARALRERVYTPQMIVEGRDVFVGSRRRQAITAIEEQLDRSDEATVTLEAKRIDEGVVDVTYRVGGSLEGRVLNVALVEDGIVSNIVAGENAGRTLLHERVVRRFEAFHVSETKGYGNVRLRLPEDAVADNLSVIAYLQNLETMVVTGASSVTLATSGGEGDG